MSEPIDYAEMLEIPVNTLNVTKKKSRKKRETDLKEQAVAAVNERAEERADAFAQPPAADLPETGTAAEENFVDYGAGALLEEKPRKKFLDSRLLIAEFAAVLGLVALILLTNIFWEDSAINTFFAGLVDPQEEAVQTVDERDYSELTLGSVVSDGSVECTVSDTGILSFTAECSVYAPYDGTVTNVSQGEDGLYTVEVGHTTSFSTVFSGLTYVYFAAGESVYSTIPLGYSDASSAVSVAMYDAGTLIQSYSVDEDNDIVWNL